MIPIGDRATAWVDKYLVEVSSGTTLVTLGFSSAPLQ